MIRNIFVAAALLALVALPGVSQTIQRNMKKEAMIWEQLKVIAPGSLEDFKAATTAMDSERYDEAVRLYQAVFKKAPNFDVVMRRLGMCLARQGKGDEGLALIEKAVAANRSADNVSALAQYLAYPSDSKQGTAEQKTRAFALIKEAIAMPKEDDDGYNYILLAQLALEQQDVQTFRRATTKLASHPELMVTHYFAAILAANDEEWLTAEREIKKAESMGLPHEVAQAFLDSGVHTRASAYRYLIYASVLVGIWIAGLGLLFLFGKLMSLRTLRSIENADPNAVAGSADLSLRKFYRKLIGIAGFYYYLSIPFVIFLVLIIAAGVTYASFMVGQIPIKLIIVVDIGALVTSYKMIRSLFIKIKRDDPGRALTYEEAPGLWDLTRKIAETLNTRPVDEIRLTPGIDVAVYERGSRREKSGDKANRILILGAGVLNGFDLNGFRAVLAHEYGHFSHRDTAGGDVALRVNEDIIKFANALIHSGENTWWNLAFHFLRIYHFIFRRISHGATRLQEVLADRVAAGKYGAQAFEAGLTHVIRKSAEFKFAATEEIRESSRARRAFQNIYEFPVTKNPDAEEAAEQSLSRKTTENDTHPSPADRFRFTRMITSQSEPPMSGVVWDLFKDRAGLTAEMTALLEHQYYMQL